MCLGRGVTLLSQEGSGRVRRAASRSAGEELREKRAARVPLESASELDRSSSLREMPASKDVRQKQCPDLAEVSELTRVSSPGCGRVGAGGRVC